MRLGHIELFCKNCDKTQAFYVDSLGFEVTEVQGGQYVWLRSDGFEILLRPGNAVRVHADYSRSGQALVIYCSDLEELSESLKRQRVDFGTPDGSPDCITFKDPDGRWIQAVESI
ncbi:hypothetical protein CCB80_14135 [Armatimonadetes bacterium Uphvl-Ar1]|nr:hypothetical protein CCB80_14135 [Armatimonadetes bacterium Uphvl-Ar1]